MLASVIAMIASDDRHDRVIAMFASVIASCALLASVIGVQTSMHARERDWSATKHAFGRVGAFGSARARQKSQGELI